MNAIVIAARRLAWLAALLAAAASQAQVFPGAQWQKAASPEAAGWSAPKLKEAEDYTRTINTDAWMLVHRGVVIHEYGNTAQPTNVASVRKSVLSILVGMQVARGAFPMDKTLAELRIDDKQALSATEQQATVRQLLQSRSGVYHPAAYETAGMKAARPARASHAPGTHHYYNNWDFNALGTIFRQTTGKTVFDALHEDLVAPLQLQDYMPRRDGFFHLDEVSVHPAYAMRLSARDMARIGLLMARNGQWNGKQLVSQRWVEESTSSHSSLRPGSGYGYMWWVGISDRYSSVARFPGKVFMAIGNLGQFIVVDPVRDIVLVHKVNFEGNPTREVTVPQFVEWMGKVLAAKTGD